MPDNLLQELAAHKIVAIVRGIDANQLDDTALALFDGGIRLLEVTMNTGGALAAISRWRGSFGNQMRVGAGTVLDVKMAQQAIDAGAEFIISPGLNEDVVRLGLQQCIPVWPGTTTPTEIVRAWQAGASAVKVFPLSMLGPQYLKDLRAPLGHIPMLAVGGVDLSNVHEFIAAGAVGAGIGGNLVDKKLIEAGNFRAIKALASQYMAAAGAHEERAA